MSARSPFIANAHTFAIDPSLVETGERIGFLHIDKASALGRLIAVDGQRDPIKVVANKKGATRPWRLVTGMHRLHGCELEGIEVIAFEVTGRPEDLADLEASENLHRRPLGPLERAKFTAALVQAAQDRIAREHGNLKQQQVAVKARWARVKEGESRVEEALRDEVEDTCANLSHVYGWEESVGEALGMSRRSIHRDLHLFRLIVEPFSDLVEQLARHPVVGENASQLKQIADVKDEAARRQVIEQLIGNDEIGADDARIQAGVDRPAGPAPAAHQKFYDQITGGWSRLGTAERRRFLPNIVSMLTPDMKRALRDMLDVELNA